MTPWALLALLTAADAQESSSPSPVDAQAADAGEAVGGDVADGGTSPRSPSLAADGTWVDVPEAGRGLRLLRWVVQLEDALCVIALERATTPEVRRYAALVRHDLAHLDLDATALADELGIDLEATAAEQEARDAQLAELVARLEAPGSTFDQRYLEVAEASREGALRQLAQVRRSNTWEPLRALLTRTLPLLGQHVALARELGRVGRT